MKWPRVRFAELFRVKHGYAFKSQFFDSSGPYVLLTPGNFHEEGGFRDQGEKQKYYTGDVPEGFILSEGDLLIAMTEQAEGLLGSSAWIPESNRYLHNQRLGLVVDLDESRLDKRCLYYLFNTADVRHQIAASASGTKVRHTAPERISRVGVNLPPVSSQRKIAEANSRGTTSRATWCSTIRSFIACCVRACRSATATTSASFSTPTLTPWTFAMPPTIASWPCAS